MEVIGLDHCTREPVGWDRITMDSGSLRVTGREIAAGLSMIIAGTATITVTTMATTRIGTTAASCTQLRATAGADDVI